MELRQLGKFTKKQEQLQNDFKIDGKSSAKALN